MITENFLVASWILTKGLALSYFFAFFSMSSQILGLYGRDGILSINQLMGLLRLNMKSEKYFHVPSLFWLNSSDLILKASCLIGMLASSLAFFGFGQSWMFLICFALYLSIVSAGQIFMNYQWDNLLLELGFLAIFFAPFNFDLHPWQAYALHPVLYGLAILLTFKVIFLSGVAKLSLKDPHWRGLTALQYHFWTQPLPNKFSLLLSHLPASLLKIMTFMVLMIELTCPLLLIFDNPLRAPAAVVLILFQVLIILTGNYGFFNLLTISLVFLGIPDSWYQSFINENSLHQFAGEAASATYLTLNQGASATAALAAAIVLIPPNLFWIVKTFNEKFNNVNFLLPLMKALAPFRITSAYGLFAVMTTKRYELVLQGSLDDQNWLDFEFHYKPHNQNSKPKMLMPIMPRLDWQLWFASNEKFEENLWLQNFAIRLLEGAPVAYDLIKKNPFADSNSSKVPPYLRFVKRELKMLPLDELLEKNGQWWMVTNEVPYGPTFFENESE